MGKMNVDDLRNVLTHSDSAWNLKEALRRAIEIIDERDCEIAGLIEELEIQAGAAVQ
jgi:hypothetical protein